jgi:hypothetical protein
LEGFFFKDLYSAPGYSSFFVGNVTREAGLLSNGSVMVNSTFIFSGQSVAWGRYNGTVSAQDVFAYSGIGHAWLISRETWDFLSYYESNPVIA